MHQLREYGGDKLVACFDPEEGSALSLEVAYSLARARVLMARGEAEGVDASAIREAIERASGAMGDVLRIKQQMTSAKTSIDRSTEILDAMAAAVRAQLMHVELLLAAAGEDSGGADGSPPEGAPPRAAPPEEAMPPEAVSEPVVAEEERLPRAATIAAGQRPRVVREPEPPFPGAQQLPF